MDGSRCVPFDKVKAELYYPSREENQQTTNLVMKMAVEVSQCMLMELRDPKRQHPLICLVLMESSAGERQQRKSTWLQWVKWQQMTQPKVHLQCLHNKCNNMVASLVFMHRR